jgi:hypothetical protein
MKTYYNYLILTLLISIAIFCSCINKTNYNKEKYYNGIDSQILNIVDSMQLCCKERPFITISFSACDRNNRVIRIFEGALTPAPPMPPAPYRKILISEADGFLGYKKYKDTYLVFEESNSDGYFGKFLTIDSLCFDEEPFTNFEVYEFNRKCIDCVSIERKYLINEKDSLIFYDGKCMFDIE